ncbi:ABC transporter permease [Aciditerrimonas ferrireducens]|jgi:ABC-type transport system involved in multi-copper enzyme maturation permease subunit|uniref:ABC transporter permease n=1 Tax=Aciditerrimonas ferrireducens TaxID=667306 RepID=A0ABV6C1H5_9ACTN
MNLRRVRAVARKELLDLRRNGNVVSAMAILPAVFVVEPLIQAFTLTSRAALALHHDHVLLYLLAVPSLVPATLASYTVVGERTQGTLEPLLSAPVRRDELVLGKALAVLVPSVLVSYLLFGLYLAVVELFAKPQVVSTVVQAPDVAVQLVFTPLLVAWSTWVGMAISARAKDLRAASQLAIVASLPTVAITLLVAFAIVPSGLKVALGFGIGLFVLDRVGWRVVTGLLDPERLVTGTR